MLNLLLNEFGANTFSVCLMTAVKGFVHTNLHDGVSFHYVVPENLCRKHLIKGSQGQPQFSTAAIMALFDEVSTYSCGMQDRKHRPGVSVHLETEVVKNVYAGDEVAILTHTDKIGNTLAFSTMEILDKDGALVAKGKHIKFLPMGTHFSVITHPLVLPWTLNFYEMLQKRKGAPQGLADHFTGKKLPLPEGFPSIDGVGRVFDILGLQRLSASEVLNIQPERSNSLTVCSNNGRIDPKSVQYFSMTVQQITMNRNGKMHGGAVGCAVEQACLLSRSANTNEHGNQNGTEGVYALNCFVKSLDVRYIAAMNGDLIVTTADDVYAPLLFADSAMNSPSAHWRARSIGKVLNKADGSICAEYVCHWEALMPQMQLHKSPYINLLPFC